MPCHYTLPYVCLSVAAKENMPINYCKPEAMQASQFITTKHHGSLLDLQHSYWRVCRQGAALN